MASSQRFQIIEHRESGRGNRQSSSSCAQSEQHKRRKSSTATRRVSCNEWCVVETRLSTSLIKY